LSRPQVTVLVLWSFGIVLAQSCGLTTVATVLASLHGCAAATRREQLRDWYREAAHKTGAKHGRKRRRLDVSTCFAPLLRWVITWWDPADRRIALAMDASTRKQRFTILSISVVVRGCAIPVAWHVVEATRAGAWRPPWEARFGALQDSSPGAWTVLVRADRGLYARWLFMTIQGLGWHPFLRINRQGQYRPAGALIFRPLSQAVTRVGPRGAGPVTCFATRQRQLDGTLLARWDTGYRDPWLVLTDLPPAQVDVAWYGLRAWSECGFKDSKRGGWHWEQTKMTDPARASRLWLAIAVAMLWTISVGSQAETETRLPTPLPLDLAGPPRIRQRTPQRRPARRLSCFRRGRLVILAAMGCGQALPLGRLLPEPWPESVDPHTERTINREPLANAA
jgi:hypothetical protein